VKGHDLDSKNTVVVYHKKCPDGFGAAFAAWLKFGDAAVYVPANYGDTPPDVAGKDLYILDFSYSREVLVELDKVAQSLTLLDHHATAEENLAGFQCQCGLVHFDRTKSGARLAWEHFNPGRPVPSLIRFIEDRDLWHFALADTRSFVAFLDTLPFDFHQWQTLLDEGTEQFAKALEVGKVLHERMVKLYKTIADDAVPLTFDGHKVLMVSTTYELTSEVGSLLAQRTGTFAAVWRLEPSGRIKVSLRAVKPFDVKVLAEYFGGGGHPQAASFYLPARKAPQLLRGKLNISLWHRIKRAWRNMFRVA
jgi:oligoribonuclease NrnB/cAMP/cGMP phosphodiesterase (DHH superfamily)